LLRRAGMLQCQPVLTPMTVTNRLTSTDGELLSSEDATMYRNIVGGLQYILHTRPDLSFVVNKVCQFLHAPAARIGLLSSEFYAISSTLSLMVCIYGLLPPASCLPFLMPTGLVVLRIGDPRGDMPSIMVLT
jgi:hypothetical protein